MRPHALRTWVTRLFAPLSGPGSVRTRLRLESVEGRVVPSATLPDEPPGGEEVTAAPGDPAPTDLGAPPEPGDSQEPNPNQGRIQQLERQLGMAEGRKAGYELDIRSEENGIRELEVLLGDEPDNPTLKNSLDLARGRLANLRTLLQGVNDEIAGIQRELARLRNRVTDELPPPPAPGAPPGGEPEGGVA